MPAQVALNLYELNTEMLTVNVVDDSEPAVAEDLSSATIEVYIKTSADTADDDPSTQTLTSSGGDVTVADPPNGVVTFRVPAAVVSAPGAKFWRLDVLTDTGATRRTAAYGDVTIVNL